MTTVASRFGWSWCFIAIAVIAALSLALLAWRMPAGLHTPTVDLKAWRELFRDRLVLLLLLVTVLQMTGQFVIFTFVGPLLTQFVGAGPDAISVAFALYGMGGFLGNLAATQVVGRLGALRTSLLSTGSVSAGIAIWAAGAGHYPLMVGGIFVWGLGFAAANSMQQARLAAAAPTQAGSAVALNTSALYIGQAIGSALGSALFVHGHAFCDGLCRGCRHDRGAGGASSGRVLRAYAVRRSTARPAPRGPLGQVPARVRTFFEPFATSPPDNAHAPPFACRIFALLSADSIGRRAGARHRSACEKRAARYRGLSREKDLRTPVAAAATGGSRSKDSWTVPRVAPACARFLKTQKTSNLPSLSAFAGRRCASGHAMGTSRFASARRPAAWRERWSRNAEPTIRRMPACLKLEAIRPRARSRTVFVGSAFCNSACILSALLARPGAKSLLDHRWLFISARVRSATAAGSRHRPKRSVAQASDRATGRLDGDLAQLRRLRWVSIADCSMSSSAPGSSRCMRLRATSCFGSASTSANWSRRAWRFTEAASVPMSTSSCRSVMRRIRTTFERCIGGCRVWLRLACSLPYVRGNANDPVASVTLRLGADQKIAFSSVSMTPQADIRSVRVDGGMIESRRGQRRSRRWRLGGPRREWRHRRERRSCRHMAGAIESMRCCSPCRG